MKTRTRRLGVVIATSALAAASITLTAPAANATVPDLAQHVAVPAYIHTTDTASWASLTGGASQLGFIVANESTGPSNAVDTDLATDLSTAHTAGTKVLGYVDTGYLGQAQGRLTTLGDGDITSWIVQAEQDIDLWYQFYGSSIDGIFLDDGLNACGPTVGSDEYIDAYTELNDYVHTYHPGSLTVLNPGITVPECYDNTADVLVTFEGSAGEYLNPQPDEATAQWQLDGDPNHFWHIIHSVADTTQLNEVIAASKTNNAGYVYATQDVLSNPYDTAPTGTFWSSELAATAATATTVPAAPSRPYASDYYSTGVVLDWASSSSSGVVGYEVYRDGLHIGSVGNYYPDDSEFRNVGLTPATTYSYTVKARHRDGKLSAASTARTVTTDVLWGDAPGAPVLATDPSPSANGVRLSWSASTVTNDPVEFYDVYANGARKATVDATTTAVHLGDLLPNTAYTFVVKARSTSNAVSAASNTVSETTANPTPVDNTSVTYDAVAGTVTFTARYNLAFTYKNVFIDTDGSTTTGYPIGGVGADSMLENDTFYQHDPATTGFDWNAIALTPGPLVSSTGGTWTWTVPVSQFGSATTLTVVFNGSATSPDYSVAPITATI